MSNDKSWGKLIASLLVALLSGGGLGGYFVHQYYTKTIAVLSETKGRIDERLKKGQEKLDYLNTQLVEKQSELDKWKQDFEDVNEKWKRCIDPSGTIVTIEISDIEIHHQQLHRDDRIEIAFISYSFYCKLCRVTTGGPVFEIFKCQNFRVKKGLRSSKDGKNSFLVTKENPLQLVYTPQSCETNDLLSDSEFSEELTINLEHFNVDQQTTEIQYQRNFLKF